MEYSDFFFTSSPDLWSPKPVLLSGTEVKSKLPLASEKITDSWVERKQNIPSKFPRKPGLVCRDLAVSVYRGPSLYLQHSDFCLFVCFNIEKFRDKKIKWEWTQELSLLDLGSTLSTGWSLNSFHWEDYVTITAVKIENYGDNNDRDVNK